MSQSLKSNLFVIEEKRTSMTSTEPIFVKFGLASEFNSHAHYSAMMHARWAKRRIRFGRIWLVVNRQIL
ncbi:unnamed protein product [Somion occarium]|uniref:Uncharacterized protein n=1 Tax=Somion occarium TaxID=3059160 RepID=A0ABP1DT28_9APHY